MLNIYKNKTIMGDTVQYTEAVQTQPAENTHFNKIFDVFKDNKTDNVMLFTTENISMMDDFFSWDDVNWCLNNLQSNFELINNNKKINIPIIDTGWVQTQDKEFIFNQIKNGTSFCITGLNKYNKNINAMCEMLENYFNKSVDVRAFGGFEGSKSFSVHSDKTANFIMHIDGESEWTVYEEVSPVPSNLSIQEADLTLTKQFNTILTKGKMMFIPYKKYYYCNPLNKRLSLSFAICDTSPNNKKYRKDYYL